MAQDVQSVAPELVTAMGADGDHLGVDYKSMVSLLAQSMKEIISRKYIRNSPMKYTDKLTTLSNQVWRLLNDSVELDQMRKDMQYRIENIEHFMERK